MLNSWHQTIGRGSRRKSPLLLYLTIVMLTLTVAILKSNLEIIPKHKHAHYKKKPHLAGLAHLCLFIWKIFISPWWDPDKWSAILPRRVTLLLTWTHCFSKSFLKKVRSHLRAPAHLTGPVHFHMNRSL